MKIQVSTNASMNHEMLARIVNERKPFDAPDVKQTRVDQAQEANLKAKESKGQIEAVEQIQRQVDQTNRLFEVNFTSTRFQVHDDTSRLMIQVIDKKTDEVVREIPSEDFLNMVSKMVEYMGGMVDEKA